MAPSNQAPVNAVVDQNGQAHKPAGPGGGQFVGQGQHKPEIALGNFTLTDARVLVGQLQPGMSVILTEDGRDYACIVQRREEGFGHPDSKNVTVGYGPGRWNREVNAAGLAAGSYGLRIETNRERLAREAAITDPNHPDFNSDMDWIIPGTTKRLRDAINAGVDTDDRDAYDAYIEREQQAAIGTSKPIDEQSPAELVVTLRKELPAGATLLLEETDQGGRWLNPIGLRLADGTELRTAEAEEVADWEWLEWAASNVRGFDTDAFVATDPHGGYWELPPATN